MVGKPPVLCPGCGGRVLWHIHGPERGGRAAEAEPNDLPAVSPEWLLPGRDRDDMRVHSPRSNGRSFGVLSQGGKFRRWHGAGHSTVQHSCGAWLCTTMVYTR